MLEHGGLVMRKGRLLSVHKSHPVFDEKRGLARNGYGGEVDEGYHDSLRHGSLHSTYSLNVGLVESLRRSIEHSSFLGLWHSRKAGFPVRVVNCYRALCDFCQYALLHDIWIKKIEAIVHLF